MEPNIPSTSTPVQPKKKIPTWIKVILVLFVLFVGFFMLLGTGLGLLGHYLTTKGGQQMIEKGLEKVIEKGLENKDGTKPDIDLDIDKEKMEIRDKESGQVFNLQVGEKIPENFPKDAPIYSPATVVSSMVLGPMKMLSLETTDSKDAVLDFYKSKLTGDGWKEMANMGMSEKDAMMMYQKDNRQLTITLSATDDTSGATNIKKTGISLMVGEIK